MNKPKPDKSIFESRQSLEHRLHHQWNDLIAEEYLSILNDYDWSTELFQVGDKFGLKMWNNTVLLPALFDDFRTLDSAEMNFGEKIVAKIGSKEGVVCAEENGWHWLLEPVFDYVSYPNDILAVKKNEKWGVYCLIQSRYIIPIEINNVVLHSGFLLMNGIGIYNNNGLWGIINEAGDFTRALFSEIEANIEGPVKVRLDEEWGYVKADATLSSNTDDAHFWYNL